MPNTIDRKKKMQTQQIFYNLLEIVELFPEYTTAQHFSGVLRRKASTGQQPYDWSEEELLKRIENYKQELEVNGYEEDEENE